MKWMSYLYFSRIALGLTPNLSTVETKMEFGHEQQIFIHYLQMQAVENKHLVDCSFSHSFISSFPVPTSCVTYRIYIRKLSYHNESQPSIKIIRTLISWNPTLMTYYAFDRNQQETASPPKRIDYKGTAVLYGKNFFRQLSDLAENRKQPWNWAAIGGIRRIQKVWDRRWV